MLNWKRITGVVIGFFLWAILEALSGKPADPGLALLAGFVTAWLCEKSNA